MALNRLGRKEEAGMALEAALSKDPENASTHANRGWALLQAGKTKDAMESFREALRLEPGSEWARQGIIEALKARNPFYRIMLKYFFFMTGLSTRAQWGVILGLYFLVRILRSAARGSPALAPLVTPILILYMVFAYCTWTAVPISNLLLRLHPFGRYALSEEEVRASNWVGAALLAALVLGTAGGVFGAGRLIVAAIGCALFVIPLAATFQVKWKDGGSRLAVLTGAIALLGVGALAAASVGHNAAGALTGLFFLGIFLFTWVANFLITR
jgi:tetratricopeptide (TPR) repeat protein